MKLSEESKKHIQQSFASLVEAYRSGDREVFKAALRAHQHNLDPAATLEEHLAKAEHEGEKEANGN